VADIDELRFTLTVSNKERVGLSGTARPRERGVERDLGRRAVSDLNGNYDWTVKVYRLP